MFYKKYFSIENRLKELGFKVDRRDLIYSFTDGRTNSLKDLSLEEYEGFLVWVKGSLKTGDTSWQKTPENKMRRKIYALFIHQMGYTEERLNEWCLKYGKFKKELNLHKYDELVQLVTQAENTYKSYQKSMVL